MGVTNSEDVSATFSIVYAICGTALVAAPEFMIERVSVTLASFGTQTIRDVTRREAILMLVAMSLAPLLFVEAARCAKALARYPKRNKEQLYYPHWLMLPWVACVLSPFFMAPLEKDYGPFAGAILYVLVPVGSLSCAAFNSAASLVDSHNAKREAGVWFLKALYMSGGILGVVAARRIFHGSPAVKDFPTGPPTWLPSFIALLLLSKFYPGLF